MKICKKTLKINLWRVGNQDDAEPYVKANRPTSATENFGRLVILFFTRNIVLPFIQICITYFVGVHSV